MRRRFYLAILGSVSALTFAAQAQAFTPPVMNLGLLKPQAPWKVGTVSPKGAAPYCAMVAKFDKRVVLAFARSAEGWGSLALDFREDFFTRGMEYEVTMRPEGGSERTLTARASSGRSVVVQIGRDDALFSELSEDGDMDVGFPTIEASFALRKFSAGYKDLKACARQMAAPAKTQAEPEEADFPADPEVTKEPETQAESAPVMPAVKAPAVPKADLSQADQIAALEQAQAQESRAAVKAYERKDAATEKKIAKAEAARDATLRKIEAAKSDAEVETLKSRLAKSAGEIEALRNIREKDAQDLNARLEQAKAAYETRVALLIQDKKDLEDKVAEGQGIIARLERTVRELQSRAKEAVMPDPAPVVAAPPALSEAERAELETYRREFKALDKNARPAAPADAAPRAPVQSSKKTTETRTDAAPAETVESAPVEPQGVVGTVSSFIKRIAPDTLIIWDDEPEVESAKPAPIVPKINRAQDFLKRVASYVKAGSKGPFPTVDGRPRVSAAAVEKPVDVPQPAHLTAQGLLNLAGIEAEGFSSVSSAGGAQARHWTSGALSGLAEEMPAAGRGLRALQKSYVDRYRADCPEKLGVHIDKTQALPGGGEAALAMLSCAMDGNRYATSAVLVRDGDRFTALVHTGIPSQALAAREAGEKIMKTLAKAAPGPGGLLEVGAAPAEAAVAPARRVAVPPVPQRKITFTYDAPAPGETLDTLVVE